jgi:hypothetical protein
MKRVLIGGFYFLGGIMLLANTSVLYGQIGAAILSITGAIILLVENFKKD